MIKTIVRSAPAFTGKEEVVVVPVFQGRKKVSSTVKKLDSLCRGIVSRSIDAGYFKGSLGETLLLGVATPKAPAHILLLGMGSEKDLDPERATKAGASASRYLATHNFKSAHLLATDETVTEQLRQILKGLLTASYTFKITSRTAPHKGPRKVTVMAPSAAAVTAGIRDARLTVEHSTVVRDLVNTPANLLGPAELASRARQLAKGANVQCRVLTMRELERMKMGAVLAVGQGSRREPKFLVLHYNKGKGTRRICLVGKAVVFDTGGISIKPWQGMNEMKGDMGGGAVAIASIVAAARLNLPIEIIALVPCVENMPDGQAFRPGDVLTTYSGKTIEVLSTDAEGRLILADALTYATEFDPDLIVDYATLTGAVTIALGTRIAAVMGNHQGHIDTMLAAGRTTGEPVWQLPLDGPFSEAVRGEVSDYKNYSGREGSSITAGALLGEFVGKTPWLHVDIAGTFWNNGSNRTQPKGATGYGVDLTLRFLESLAE